MKNIRTNLAQFNKLVQDLAKTTGSTCLESSVFIGEVSGKPVRLTVMTYEEAVAEHGYDPAHTGFFCVHERT